MSLFFMYLNVVEEQRYENVYNKPRLLIVKTVILCSIFQIFIFLFCVNLNLEKEKE